MRRKPGSLVPLELAICDAAVGLRRRGTTEFHGYLIAKTLKTESDRKLLTAYGTLYRALGRLEEMGILESRWEDPHVAAAESRPGRRLYALTAAADELLADARKAARAAAPGRKRLAPA